MKLVKFDMIKMPGGLFTPASDTEAEALERFKTGEQYQVDIKLPRNPSFHGKTFAFFKFCFDHWKSDKTFLDERGQIEVFRKNLTVLAGFYNSYYNIKGEVRIEAKSLAYENMDQETFEQHYNALINAALEHIFVGADRNTESQLMSFF